MGNILFKAIPKRRNKEFFCGIFFIKKLQILNFKKRNFLRNFRNIFTIYIIITGKAKFCKKHSAFLIPRKITLFKIENLKIFMKNILQIPQKNFR